MAETQVRIIWRLGDRMTFAWGDPEKPLGPTGLRDRFVQEIDDSWINEDGVVKFRIFATDAVFDDDDVPTPSPLAEATCTYLAASNGVHFYLSLPAADYDFVRGSLPEVILDADAAVLLGVGHRRLRIPLEIV